MAQLTPEQFQKKIEAKMRSLNIAKTIVFPVATAMQDKMRQRLFQEGVGGDGNKTGAYSTTPMYASKSVFVGGGFSPRGKNAKKTASGKLAKGSKNKKSGVRKTMYLAGGYKELRQVQGKETAFVNLQYSGLLFTDFTKLKIEKDSVISSVGSSLSADKLKWLSDKYGKDTFQHTKEERVFFATEIKKNLIKYLNT